MNGKTARRLRKIARELKLDPETQYAPHGPLRRLPERSYVDRSTGIERTIPGGVLRRPFAMIECERRAYKEAKSIYSDSCLRSAPTPTERRERQEQRLPHDTGPNSTPFHVRAVDSMRAQPETPVA